MSHKVISLKYRPQRFEDVVGQDHITVTIKNAIRKNRLGHAYIFSGPRGTGKTTTARILAKAVNCENPVNGNPCNKCISCREITEGRSLDIFEIDGASNRGIEDIRNLREQVKYPPTRGKYRIYIIDEFHQITKDALNALLKTLEEPPPHVLFIFATTELRKVIPTILSRCQRFEFKRIPIARVQELLREIAEKESINIDDDSLLLIAKNGEGSIRDSESILEQVFSFSEGAITYEKVSGLLGVVPENIYMNLYRAISSSAAGAALQNIDDMIMDGYDLMAFINDFTVFLRDLYLVKIAGSGKVLNTSSQMRDEFEKLAQVCDERDIIRMLSIVSDQIEVIRRADNSRILIEALIMKLCRHRDFVDLDQALRHGGMKAKATARPVSRTDSSASSKRSDRPASMQPGPEFKSRILDKAPVSKVAGTKETPNKLSDIPSGAPVSMPSIQEVKKKWPELIERVNRKRPALAGVLGQVGIRQIEGYCIIIGSSDNYSLDTVRKCDKDLQFAAEDIFGKGIRIRINKCEVKEDERAVERKKIDKSVLNVIEAFDGELL